MKKKVLVTGASGFLGRRAVLALQEKGHDVVAFVRASSEKSLLENAGAEIAIGDITNVDSLRAAATGVDAIVHAAADTMGTEDAGKSVTLGGTLNVLDVCRSQSIEKLVYISSCSVYEMATARSGQTIDETHTLESRPKERGPYTQYKLEAENAVSDASRNNATKSVILRPGSIYGPGTDVFPAMLGFAIKGRFFVVIGMGGMCPPWVHVDNVADAIRLSIEEGAAEGQIFNVVDAPPVSKRQYIDKLIRKLTPDARVVYVPYAIIYAATVAQELLFAIIRKKPFLTRYRLVSSQRNVTIDGSKIRNHLDWEPAVNLDEAIMNWQLA